MTSNLIGLGVGQCDENDDNDNDDSDGVDNHLMMMIVWKMTSYGDNDYCYEHGDIDDVDNYINKQ